MSTKNTYKQTEVGLIPEDWEVKKLGECSSISGDYGINAPAVKFSEDLPTYLRITDIDDDGNYSKVNKVSVKDDNSENFILENQDIVFARTGATVGKTYLHDKKENGDLVFAGFLIRFRTNRDVLLPYYLKLYSTTDKYWNWVSVFSMRSGQPGINSTEYSNLKIPLPPLPEQKKIADCLSTWDIAIEKQSQLINALTQRKKALMQQLLTGKKRLPGFSGEWKEISLIELADFRRGSFPQPYGLPEWYDNENGEPFIQVYDVGDNFNLKPTTKSKISELAQVQSVFIKKGTLIVTLQGSIGKVAITNYDAYIDRTLLLFSSFKMKVDIYFIMYQIHNLFNIEKEKAPGGIIKTITKEVLSNFKIKLPSFEEQTAIAEILATADRELQLQKEKLAQLQTQKKGLMQVLLTGKKRLIN